MTLAKPSINSSISGYELYWDTAMIKCAVSHLNRHSSGEVKGEVRFFSCQNGSKPARLGSPMSFNFLWSTKFKSNVAETLNKRFPSESWEQVIESLCDEVLELERTGEPLSQSFIDEESDIIRPHYVVYPFLLEKQLTVIYGPPGALKSITALIIMITAALPWDTNPLGWTAPKDFVNTAWLDWEADENTTKWRLRQMQKGMLLPSLPLNYNRMSMPLIEDVSRIQQIITDQKIKLLIIDSLAPACGGNLNRPGEALELWKAIRQLDCTILMLAHSAKPSYGDNAGPTSIFGSIFFEAQSRMIWEAQKKASDDSDSAYLYLSNRKSNFTRAHKAVGIKLTFDETNREITFCPPEPSTMQELREHFEVKYAVESYIKSHGPSAQGAIAKALQLSRLRVQQELAANSPNKFILVDGKWGLKDYNDIIPLEEPPADVPDYSQDKMI